MATFSATQITDLAEILETNSSTLGDHLALYAAVISDTDKTRVLALVTEWQSVSTTDMVTTIEPKDRNFGVRVSAGAGTSSVARRIASLLQWTTTVTSSSQVVLERG